MKISMQVTKRVGAFALALVACLPLAAVAQTPNVGDSAPNFTLATPEGMKTSLEEFTAKGTVVLVLLRGYPGYQCPYCVKQVHDFVENAEKFKAQHTEVLLVYPGPPAELDAKAKEFLAKQANLPENIHLVIDPDYRMTKLYGLRWDAPRETAYPSTFLVDHQGKVFYAKVSRSHGDRTTAEDLLGELAAKKHGK